MKKTYDEKLTNIVSKQDTRDKLGAIIELENCTKSEQLINVVNHFDNWQLLRSAETYAKLGLEYEEINGFDFPKDFDYEKYGMEVDKKLGGTFTIYGYVYREV